MGLFDKLFDKGVKALGDIVSDTVSSALGGEQDTWEEPGSGRRMEGSSGRGMKEKSFKEKIQDILQRAGNYELRENISPEELEREFGRAIFTRGNGCCSPAIIDYAVYQGGNRVLLIRVWDEYTDYNHRTNRQIKEFCDTNGVKMLDFFAYLPNEEDYMEQRIREQLV